MLFSIKTRLTQVLLLSVAIGTALFGVGHSYAQEVTGDEINSLIVDLAGKGQGGDSEALFDALSSYRATQDWPDSDAIVVEQGSCTFVSTCSPDNHDADVTLPAVSNVQIIYPEATSTDVGTEFKVVWDPPSVPSGVQYSLSRYEVSLILAGKEYENFIVAPELQDDGSYQLKNSIRIRDRKPGRHYVHVRAVYEAQSEGFSSGLSANLRQSLVAPSREGFSGGFASTWGGGGFGDVVTPTKVQDLASVNAALHACISAVYSATTLLNSITSLTCRNQNISDLEGIQHLSALRALALSNGRDISGGNLPNHNNFNNLSKLFSLADLVTLDISNTSVSVSQIESLMDNVTSIESLRIAYIPLASFPDLRPQPGLGSTIITNLKILDISYTGLSSINTGAHKISDLNSLHALSASGNPLDKNFSLSSNSNLFEAILKDIDVHGSLSMANFPDNLDYLYLSDQSNALGNNPFSELVTLIQSPTSSVEHAGVDHVLDLSGNTGMYCSNVKAVETWFWARTDACAANPFTGECTRPHLAIYSPSYCYPDKVNNFSVYRNVSGAFVFNWDAVPNNWGVVRYEIDTYDSNNQQTRLEVTDTQSEQLVASYLAQDSVQFEMRACVAQQCGESTGLMTLSPDLTRAKNITSVWSGSSFQLQWQYPVDVFNHSGGRGKPDYFLVLPAVPKAGSPGQYQVNVTQNTISSSTTWTSSFLSPINNASHLYRVRACRLDNGIEYCGPSVSVDVEPNQNGSIATPTNVSAVMSGGINRVLLTWNQVNDPTVDYYQIREDYEPQPGDNRSQTQTRIFYSEKDNVSINRENNGDYRYQVRACRRDRSSAGDSCSTASPLTSEVTIATNPNNVLTANTAAGASGWIPHNGGARLALRLQNTTPSTVLPEYFKIEVVLDSNEPWRNFSFYTTRDHWDEGRNRFLSPENIVLPKPSDVLVNGSALNSYQVNIQGCINGHVCSPASVLTIDENQPLNDEILGGGTGGPGDLNPGLWWNPDYAGTGWYFYWSSGLRYPQVHENYGNTYDLIAVWGSYQLIDGVWSPIWMYAELKLSPDGNFYSGAMYYPQKPTCTGTGDNRDCQENIVHAADIEIQFKDSQGNGGNDNNVASVIIKHMNLPGMPDVDLDQGVVLDITNFEATGLCTVAGPTCQAFGADNSYDYLSGLWSPDTDGDGVFIDEEFIVMNWIEKSLEGMMVGFYDDSPTGSPIYALAQSCRDRPSNGVPADGVLQEGECDRPSKDYLEYTSFVSDNPNSVELPNNHNFFYSVESGYAPTEQKPDGFDITERNFMLPPANGEITGGGRRFSTESFNRGSAWFNFKYSLDDQSRTASLIYGSKHNEKPLVRGANYHDIRHFIDGVENAHCLDVSAGAQCNLTLTWFTDDFYRDATVYFQKDQETPQHLNGLCGPSPFTYVVQDFACTISGLEDRQGTYRFFLINERNPIDGWDPNEVIARSQPLKIGNISVENMPPVADIDPPSITGLVHPNPNHDATVGAVAGSPGTSGGAASYNIPITLPPGRQGMAPSVGIGYNSRSGNGVMGMGWSLSAGSSIHRCPMTVAQDGSTIGVQYTENDRLCLDGQRLIRVNAGDYWATAGEYRTELNSFVKIEMLGGSADSAANARGVGLSFEVYGKDNILREYGVSTTGRVQPSAANGNLPAVVSNWLLELESDPAGNRIDYDYTNFGYGEYLLSQILYTGFNNTPGNRAVQLSYGNRSAALEGSSPAVFKDDYASSWQAGYETRQTKKLEKITTCTDVSECSSSGKVREYQLSYVSSNSTQRLLFNSITECAFVNGAPTCLEPTLFSWISKQPKFVYEKLTSNAVDYIPNTDFNQSVWAATTGDMAAPDIDILGDYNGDGVREMRMSMQGKSYLVSVDAAGVIQGKIRLSDATIQALTNYRYRGDQDFNDDGRSDFLVAVKDTANTLESDPYVYAIAQWKPGFTFNCTGECTISQAFDIRRTNITADVIEVPVGPGAGDEDDDGDNSVIIQLPTNTPHVADFNGDGQKDLMLLGTQNQLELYINIEDEAAAQVNNASNINFTSALIIDMPDFVEDPSDPQSDLLVYRQPQLADFDGDGAVDIMLQVDPVGDLDPIDNINAGFGAVIFNNLQSSGYQVTGVTTTANIAAYFSDVRIVSTMVANLQGGPGSYPQIALAMNPLLQYYQMLDINGDGLQDLLYVDDLTSANCEQLPGTSSLSHEWHYQLNTGDRDFLFTSGVATGNCRGLERVSGTIGYPTPVYSRLMKLFDYNNDGRSEIMVPENLHQAICYLPARVDSGTVEPRSYCPAEPNGVTPGWTGTCNAAEASLCEMYEYGKGSQDQSTYAMGLLSFKANSSGAYTIDTIPAVDTGLVTSAHMKADDLFGDGVSNVYGRVGCIESPVGATNSGMSSDRCEISAGFPTGGAAEAGLKAGLRGYYQNRMILNSPAGALPAHSALDLLSSVSDAFDNQVYWSYLPLSAERDVPSVDLPLYRIPDRDSGDSLYDYDPAHHFYFQSSMYVVSSMQISNGLVIGGNDQFNTTYYGYEEAVFNNQGRGFQGFRKVLSVDQTADSDNDLLTVSSFHQVFPLAGRLYETMVHKASVAMDDVGRASHALSVSTTDWACWAATNGLNNEGTLQNLCAINNDNQAAVHQGGVYQVVSSGSQARSQEPNDAYKTYACTETFNVAYDGYGNRLRESMRSREFIAPINNGPTACFADADLEQSKTTVYDYTNNESSWWLGRLDHQKTTTSLQYSDALVDTLTASQLSELTASKTVSQVISWNNYLRKPTCMITVADDFEESCHSKTNEAPFVQTITQYDTSAGAGQSYGNPVSVSVVANDAASETPARTTTSTYSADGYFVNTVVNPLGHSIETVVDPREGNPLRVKDANEQVARMDYDAFGRNIRSWYPRSQVANAQIGDDADFAARANHYAPRTHINYRPMNSTACGLGNINRPEATYCVVQRSDGSPEQVQVFDRLNRAIFSGSKGFANNGGSRSWSVVESLYNARGQMIAESVPRYLNSANSYWTDYSYDVLNRTTEKHQDRHNGDDNGVDGLDTFYRHQGLLTRIFVGDYGATQPAANAVCSTPNYQVNLNNPATLALCMERTYSAGGQLLSTKDANGEDAFFLHDSQGNPAYIRDVEDNVIYARYNAFAQREFMSDPNQGDWSFTYNGLGELTKQIDARDTEIQFQYDLLGRMTERRACSVNPGFGSTCYEGATPAESQFDLIVDSWHYDNGAITNGSSPSGGLPQTKGLLSYESRLVKTSGGLGSEVFREIFKRHYEYDSDLRPGGHITTVNPLTDQNTAKNYQVRIQNDSYFARPFTVTWPGNNLRLYNRYDQQGYLTHEGHSSHYGQSNELDLALRRVISMTPTGQVELERYGNNSEQQFQYNPSTWQLNASTAASLQPNQNYFDLNYRYDLFGNITKQTKAWPVSNGANHRWVQERFDYDHLHRLRISERTWGIGAVGAMGSGQLATIDFEYSPNGNLTSKSDYANSYLYAANQVQQVTLDNGDHRHYQYDANGNMIRAYDTGGIGGNADRKLLKFDAYNKPTRIRNSGLDQNLEDNGHVLEFSYGSNGQRFYQLKGDAPGQGSGYVGDEYKIYIDKMMEITGDINDTQDSGAKLYIGDYAVYDISTDLALARSQAKLQYLYRDRLGSVVAIADSNGDLVETAGRGFDPFGKPREDDWSDSDHRNNGLNDQGDTASLPGDLNRDDLTTRGFTGHEHLNETDLIHMNGRVYDYNLGRFYSVDPFIQFPENSQSVNGYSYILNNPMSGTDPSGYKIDCDQGSCNFSGGDVSSIDGLDSTGDNLVVTLSNGKQVAIALSNGNAGSATVNTGNDPEELGDNTQKKNQENANDSNHESNGFLSKLLPKELRSKEALLEHCNSKSRVGPCGTPESNILSDEDITNFRNLTEVAFLNDPISGFAANLGKRAARGAVAGTSAGKAQSTAITVYRVEGSGNRRLIINSDGTIGILEKNKTLFLNFGSRERAVEFLEKRLGQGFSDTVIKSFKVPARVLDELRNVAVPQSLGRQFPDRPQVVDPTKAINQFGLKRGQIINVENSVIPGTAKIEK